MRPRARRSAPERVVEIAVEHGLDSMSFLAVESGMRHWLDDQAPDSTRSCVAYVETPQAWVAAGSPAVDGDAAASVRELQRTALRFIEAARSNGKRACFFACEALAAGRLPRLLIGEQPIFHPREWLRDLAKHRRLREQLRRARAKGLTVRGVAPAELEGGSPLRAEVERLASDWLRSRHIEPMGFLVALEPFHHPAQHRYFIAELDGRLVAFLSAVPIGQRRAWLVEDVVRSARAPNGTAESLLVALMRREEDSEYVTLGLTPLAGPIAWPLRVARWAARPLFDFEGLRAFRQRLHPHAWQSVWLVSGHGKGHARSILDSLRAFAGGSVFRFGVRSLVRHPSGLPWLMAVPLPFWTVGLAWLVAVRRTSLLGLSPLELGLWIGFDTLLLLVLVRAAMRPARSRLLVVTSIALLDAVLSVAHLVEVGGGSTVLEASLRMVSATAPAVGAALLAWATTQTSTGSPSAPHALRRAQGPSCGLVSAE